VALAMAVILEIDRRQTMRDESIAAMSQPTYNHD